MLLHTAIQVVTGAKVLKDLKYGREEMKVRQSQGLGAYTLWWEGAGVWEFHP